MKLKNKRTGNIMEIVIVDHGADWEIRDMYADEHTQTYNSLAELNEEWEDAPEDAIQVYIEGIQNVFMSGGRVYIDYATAKEAEESVRKLKAWKRLKDKGFRFEGHSMLNYAPNDTYDYSPSIGFSIPELDKDEPYEYPEEIEKDLDICFGGEE